MKISWFKINPHFIVRKFANSIIWNYQADYFLILYYLKIGLGCKDCNKKYNFCLCLDKNNFQRYNNSREFIVILSKQILSKFFLNRLKNETKSIFESYELGNMSLEERTIIKYTYENKLV